MEAAIRSRLNPMSVQKTLVVATEFGDVTVKKLALGDYAKLLRSLDVLPKKFAEIFQKEKSELTTDVLLSVLPSMAADALPELAGVLASATDKDSKFIQQLDLADTIDILDAALELNDFSRIQSSIKKITSRKARNQGA